MNVKSRNNWWIDFNRVLLEAFFKNLSKIFYKSVLIKEPIILTSSTYRGWAVAEKRAFLLISIKVNTKPKIIISDAFKKYIHLRCIYDACERNFEMHHCLIIIFGFVFAFLIEIAIHRFQNLVLNGSMVVFSRCAANVVIR